MKVVALANNKGGVGKTTTSLNLAAGLREKKKKVLLIDLDMQQNLALTCGVEPDDLQGSSLYDVFKRKVDINSCLFQIFDDVDDLDILVGGIEEDSKLKENSLKNALMNLNKQYDFVVIDTPPSLNIVTKMAITAADDLIIPVQPSDYSLWGIGRLVGFIQDVNPDINLAGLLLVSVKEWTNLGKKYIKDYTTVAKDLNTRLFKAMIPPSNSIPESQHNGTTIYKHAPRSTVAKAYMSFTEEYLKGVKKHG